MFASQVLKMLRGLKRLCVGGRDMYLHVAAPPDLLNEKITKL